ncbi:hypothetical protein [Candidatus Carsonella ruddii]|uniref:hypothetical protein n=1 Tax=Carsonella ruddii TaxID=114186 RepID=UPI003D819383
MNKFFKIHASGNNFLVIFNKKSFVVLNKYINNKVGIGCDQILIINKINLKNKIIKIQIFNNNLSIAKNCGNGIRCLSWFFLIKIKKNNFISFDLDKKYIHAWKRKKIFTLYKFPNFVKKLLIRINNIFLNSCFVNLINLHIVFFINNIKTKKIKFVSKTIKYFFNDAYNIEFVQILKNNKIYIRIFEKAVGETYSCGSGIISSICYIYKYIFKRKNFFVNSIGGNCQILVSNNNIIIYGNINFCYFGFI